MIKITKNPTSEQINKFETFASKNWGKHSEGGDSDLDFYDYHRMIFENYLDGELVSGLVVFVKAMVFSDRVIQFAGIGGVVTEVAHRHRGLALATLNYAMAELERLKIGVILLCTDIDKLGTLYAKAGFVPLGKPYYFIDKNGKRKSEPGGMIANTGDAVGYEFVLNTKEEIFVGLSNF